MNFKVIFTPISVTGISILKGFGFIQYADESSAESAIRGAQNMDILGHRMGNQLFFLFKFNFCFFSSTFSFQM